MWPFSKQNNQGRNMKLINKRVIISGCGCKPIEHEFKDLVTGELTHTEIIFDGQRVKLNVGASVAYALIQAGVTVHMVSLDAEKLGKLKSALVEHLKCNPQLIEYSGVDLLDQEKVKKFVEDLPKDKPIYWVQSIGLGAGSYKLKDDNPYLPLEDIEIGLIEAESQIVLRGTHLLMQALLPILKKQQESKIVVITSLSATRGYDLGGTHCAAKGAIDRYVNSAMLGLSKFNIFVTAIRPGIVDTGMYDKPAVTEAVKHVGKEYGWEYKGDKIPLASPLSVGYLIRSILESPAHVTSINIVAKRQWPNEAS